MFRRVLPYILAMFGVLLDVSILPQLVASPILPIFSYCAVVAFGMVMGSARGALIGLFSGFLVDSTVGSPVGLLISIYVFAGWSSGIVGRKKRRNLLMHLLTPVACITVYELTMVAFRYISYGALILGVVPTNIVRAILETVLTHVFYFIFAAILTPRRSRYTE